MPKHWYLSTQLDLFSCWSELIYGNNIYLKRVPSVLENKSKPFYQQNNYVFQEKWEKSAHTLKISKSPKNLFAFLIQSIARPADGSVVCLKRFQEMYFFVTVTLKYFAKILWRHSDENRIRKIIYFSLKWLYINFFFRKYLIN